MNSVTIREIIEGLNLEVLHLPEKEIRIHNDELIRPGLQLAGYFDMFAYERIQIFGKTESNYIETLAQNSKINRIDKIFSYPIPAAIVCSNMNIDSVMVYCAKKHDRPLLRTKDSTTKLISRLDNFLEAKLAPEITVHGVMVEVYGIGILLTGKSGIGKSETALELVKRGHRLVSDDAVIIKLKGNTLECTSPEITRHLLEIRGVGILDINHLYGVGSIRLRQKLNVVINLEEWDQNKDYDRLGFDEKHIKILGKNVRKMDVPVRTGRNIAMIVEVAAMSIRQKILGYNIEDEYNKRFENFNKKKKS
jgi:HPr kinase/phosphorylase